MKSRILLFALAGLLLACPPAMADTLVGSAGGSWTNLAGVPSGNPSPFWDNPSSDGPNLNVGFQINQIGVPNAQYWSIGGLADNNVIFNGDGSGQTQTLLIEISGYADMNAFYAYNVADPLQTTQLFAGGDSPVASKNIPIPYAQYGFMLVSPLGTFYSGNGPGTRSDGTSNFAFFQSANLPETWWIGIEDCTDAVAAGTYGEGPGDYNDMLVKVTAAPLPSAVLLFGSGMLGLLGIGCRRKTK
jgi:hypothetical protein